MNRAQKNLNTPSPPDIGSKQMSNWPLHGGDILSAAQSSGIDPSEILDFSSSVNRMGPPAKALELLQHSEQWIQSYPDPECREFKTALNKVWGVPKDKLTASNGSTELIYELPGLISSLSKIIILDPSFSEYRKAFEQSGFSIISLFGSADNGFKPPLEKIIFEALRGQETGAIILGQPGSPAGQLWSLDEFRQLLSFCEKNKILLIIDETFAEFSNAFFPSEESDFLIQIRSMTKFHALPGLRLGYGIFPSRIIRNIESKRPPWSVNALAQKLGTAALLDENYAESVKSWNDIRKDALFKKLESLSSIRPFPSSANFILFRLNAVNDDLPKQLFEGLLQDGILVRNCGNFSGLDETYFRVAVRNDEENDRLMESLRKNLDKLKLI